MKSLNKAMQVYENSPDEAVSMVAGWLEQTIADLDNTPRVVKCRYNSGHGDRVVNYGEVRQDVYRARKMELKRIGRIYEIVSNMGG